LRPQCLYRVVTDTDEHGPGARHGTGDVRFFDRIAGLYDLAMPPARPADLRAGLRFADRPVERVLDAAGGTGRAARAVTAAAGVVGSVDAVGHPSVTVLDISREMLTRAAADGLPAVQGDLRTPPIQPGSVDAAVVTDALHHVPDAEQALASLAATVAPGGVVVVREFDPETIRGRGLALAERLVGMDSTFLSPATVQRTLRRAGLRAYEIQPGFGYTVVGVVPRADDEARSRDEPEPRPATNPDG
jgi:demethylmenaquinone methyltransferase/2-methoxy-6-polyprenyl-1,4-benzoquinol methylase